jgi:hypothetical protein
MQANSTSLFIASSRDGDQRPEWLNVALPDGQARECVSTQRCAMKAAVAPVSRLLVPARLGDTRDLRAAAAQLRADALLIYTIDTRFRTESAALGPLQTIALGFLPSRKAVVNATCAFMIVDVRTGFVYGTGETTATEDQRSDVWGTERAIEAARLKAERQAFEDGLGEVETLWASIVAQHGPGPAA